MAFLRRFRLRTLLIGTVVPLCLAAAANAAWQATVAPPAADALGLVLVGANLLLSLLLALVAWHTLRRIGEPTAPLQRLLRENDLTVRLPERGSDELAQMAHGINAVLDKLSGFTAETMRSLGNVAAAVGEVTGVSDRTEAAVQEQSRDIAGIATAMHEMSAAVQEVAAHTSLAAEAAENTDREAQQGHVVLAESSAAIELLVQRIEHAAQVVTRLENECGQVGQVLEVIATITEKTNLLALNASIEAARAGDAGRGFAVVADEVRALAGQTQSSTGEIGALVERLQSEARAAVAAIADSRDQARQTVQRTARTGEALERIIREVGTIRDTSQQIAQALEEQNRATDDINDNIARVAQVAEDTTDAAHQMVHAAGHIGERMERLRELVGRFRVADAGLDLSAARTAHLAWKSRLRAFLDGKSELAQEQVMSHKDCALGKWYYGEGLAQYRQLPQMRELETPHAELHKVIRKVVEARNAGRTDEAEALFKQVAPLSERIVAMLEEIERQAAAAPAKPRERDPQPRRPLSYAGAAA